MVLMSSFLTYHRKRGVFKDTNNEPSGDGDIKAQLVDEWLG